MTVPGAGSATRVLHTDSAIYADVVERCACGSNTVKVTVRVE